MAHIRFARLLRISLFLVAVTFALGFYLTFFHFPPIRQTYPPPLDSSFKSPEQFKFISYENYAFIESEQRRSGYGERGSAVVLDGEEGEKSKQFLNQNGFNTYISDLISINRSVADIRHPNCQRMLYSSKLPSVSIVIPFFEENWNALLRTVYSALKDTNGLIKEIILVDDGSSRSYLKAPLDEYLKTNFPNGLVRVIHSPKREGLIVARLIGAKNATGEVLIFLDSHCETNINWLPPLLDPIARDRKTVTCPFIDVIDADTFQYRAQDEGARGAFDWELYYKRLPRLESDRFHPERPFDSPVMAGGLFAISASWFWELGGYDPGLQIWGGEQYELSFKIWMCGGRMIDIPCSRIGHIYRTHPTNFPHAGGDFLGRNYKRVAEVWMDEYKEYVYRRRPNYRSIDPGDLTEQRALRQRLQCKSFHWFMTEIAFDLVKKYPLINPISAATGDIRPVADQTMCIDAMGASLTVPIKLSKCLRDSEGPHQGVQNFEFSYNDDIHPVNVQSCWDVPNAARGAGVKVFACHGARGNQHFAVEPLHNNRDNPVRLRHVGSDLCVEANVPSRSVVLKTCDSESEAQTWIWQSLRFSAAENSKREAGLL